MKIVILQFMMKSEMLSFKTFFKDFSKKSETLVSEFFKILGHFVKSVAKLNFITTPYCNSS